MAPYMVMQKMDHVYIELHHPCEKCLAALVHEDSGTIHKLIELIEWMPEVGTNACALLLRLALCCARCINEYGPIVFDAAKVIGLAVASYLLLVYSIVCWFFPDLIRRRTPNEEEQQRYWRKSEQTRIEQNKYENELAQLQRWINQERNPRQKAFLELQAKHVEERAWELDREAQHYLDRYRNSAAGIED